MIFTFELGKFLDGYLIQTVCRTIFSTLTVLFFVNIVNRPCLARTVLIKALLGQKLCYQQKNVNCISLEQSTFYNATLHFHPFSTLYYPKTHEFYLG